MTSVCSCRAAAVIEAVSQGGVCLHGLEYGLSADDIVVQLPQWHDEGKAEATLEPVALLLRTDEGGANPLEPSAALPTLGRELTSAAGTGL